MKNVENEEKKEISKLWIEVTYLRFLLMKILESNPSIKPPTEEDVTSARGKALKYLLKNP